MLTARDSLAAAAFGSKLFTFGASNESVQTVEVYDPALSTWSTRFNLVKGRTPTSLGMKLYGPVASTIDGVFYVAGGRDFISISNKELQTFEAFFDPLLPAPAITETDPTVLKLRRLRAEAALVNSKRRQLRETSARLRKIVDGALEIASDPKGRLRPEIMRRRPSQNEEWLLNSTAATDPLRQILMPFAAFRESDYSVVKFTGDAGAKLEASEHQPDRTMEQLAEELLSSERRSVVLRLENIIEGDALRTTMNTTTEEGGDDEKESSALRLLGPIFGELLQPFLPIGITADKPSTHVYLSNGGASALKNHTDVTEIVALQVLGHKEWLFCTVDDDDHDDDLMSSDSTTPSWLKVANAPETTRPGEKLAKCSTYDRAEMADASLACERVVTAPGDALFLPRETIHSARSVGNEISVHLTIGIPARQIPDNSDGNRTPGHRRLGTCDAAAGGTNCNGACDDTSNTYCDTSCNTACDGDCTDSCDTDCDGDCYDDCDSGCGTCDYCIQEVVPSVSILAVLMARTATRIATKVVLTTATATAMIAATATATATAPATATPAALVRLMASCIPFIARYCCA
jgi:hypothetical protein